MAKKSVPQGVVSGNTCTFMDEGEQINQQEINIENKADITDPGCIPEPEACLCLLQEHSRDGREEAPKMPSDQAAKLPEPEASVTRFFTPKLETTTTRELQQNADFLRLCNRVDTMERLLSSMGDMGERVNDLEEKQKRLYKGHSRHCLRTTEGMRKLEEMIAKK